MRRWRPWTLERVSVGAGGGTDGGDGIADHLLVVVGRELLPDELARWVEEKSQASGRSKGSLVKEALELIQVKEVKPFMRLAGKVKGTSDLSSRKGFSKA